MCFDVRGLGGSGGPQTGVFRIVSGSTNEVVFDVTDGVWTRVCLEVPDIAADGSDLMFGTNAAPGFRYAVDDIGINLPPAITDDAPTDGGVAIE